MYNWRFYCVSTHFQIGKATDFTSLHFSPNYFMHIDNYLPLVPLLVRHSCQHQPQHITSMILYPLAGISTILQLTTNHKIQNQFICPTQKKIAMYIHGGWTDEAAANEQFDRIAKSITINNYSIPLIGFSWDANTPLNKSGWEIVKKIATDNGQKLAQFISDFKNKCKDVDKRLIAHSLAAAIVNSTLITISNNQNSNLNNDSNFNIKSVHLLGAAMDRSAAASNTTFGKSIARYSG